MFSLPILGRRAAKVLVGQPVRPLSCWFPGSTRPFLLTSTFSQARCRSRRSSQKSSELDEDDGYSTEDLEPGNGPGKGRNSRKNRAKSRHSSWNNDVLPEGEKDSSPNAELVHGSVSGVEVVSARAEKSLSTDEPKPTDAANVPRRVPKEIASGPGRVYTLGPSRDVKDEERYRKKLAMVDYIEDEEVREIAMEELDKRDKRFDLMDRGQLFEKMERRQELGQPNIPAKDGIRMLVIEPRINREVSKNLRGTGEQRRNISEWNLREACSLVDCMGSHYAAGRYILSVNKVTGKSYFGERNLAEMKEIIGFECFEEVMINELQLTVRQNAYLKSLWKCTVWDRFNTVLRIFQHNAKSKVAQLQIKLAELHYEEQLRRQAYKTIIQDGTTKLLVYDLDFEREVDPERIEQEMARRIKTVTTKLEAAKKHMRFLRDARKEREVPTVALVGYTNAGKTSLVQHLSPTSKVEGESKMFATLDTTAHRMRLPSGLKGVVTDTIGFISDLPHHLIATFESTLADALDADVVLHVRDISHPNTEGQRVNVHRTLLEIGFSPERIADMIEVRNKIDLFTDLSKWEQSLLPGYAAKDKFDSTISVDVSAKKGSGIDELKAAIDLKMRSAGRHFLTLTIPSAGEHYQWLSKNADISKTDNTEDGSQLIVEVIITSSKIGKFAGRFRDVKVDHKLLHPKETFGINERGDDDDANDNGND